VIPISDDVPRRRVPVVTYGLIAANAAIFVYELLLGAGADTLFWDWGAVPARITDPWSYPLASITLFTSMFLHAGWSHFGGNMLYLWIFGDNVEDVLGKVGYLLFYLAAGAAAGLAQIIVAPASDVPSIGASGAIAGVLGAYILLFPQAPVRVLVPGFYLMRVARVPALIVLGFWFILQLFNGLLTVGTMHLATGGVAWFAHIGGFAVGLGAGAILRYMRR
jgi:membrane associated rhomboid family serine protease